MAQRSLPKRRRGGVPDRTRSCRRVAILVTLSLASGGWTYTLVSADEAARDEPASLPSPSVPEMAPVVAASVSSARAVQTAEAGSAAARAKLTDNAIPAPALAAYQRAAHVLDAADPACRLDWSLLAAIGHVESNHGRHGENVLRSDGISTPGIYGLPLDGRPGTTEIRDTDAGLYDRDEVFDRAVGAMQFIPETWSRVGVDADGDGRRDPQDIDDAALAAGVYLCSGSDDLSTAAGQVAAVHRYNHSDSYVRLVRSLAASYAAGDQSATALMPPAAARLAARDDDRAPVTDAHPVSAAAAPPTPAPVVRKPAVGSTKPAGGGGAAEPPAAPQPAGSPILVGLQDVTVAGTTAVLGTVSLLDGLTAGLLTRP